MSLNYSELYRLRAAVVVPDPRDRWAAKKQTSIDSEKCNSCGFAKGLRSSRGGDESGMVQTRQYYANGWCQFE
jgi:hypothetical protein